MALRTLILFLLAVLAAVFVVVNWQGVMAVTTVNLVYTQIQAPLGLILICIFGALWAVGILWAMMQQLAILMEMRKAYKIATSSKELADKAELSRLENMRKVLSEEMEKLSAKVGENVSTAMSTHTEHMTSLVDKIEGIAKTITGLEDKVDDAAAAATAAKDAAMTVNETVPMALAGAGIETPAAQEVKLLAPDTAAPDGEKKPDEQPAEPDAEKKGLFKSLFG